MTLEYGDRVYCEHNGRKYGRGHIMTIHGDPATYYDVRMENGSVNGFPSKSVMPCWQQDFQERINERLL